MWGTNFLRPRTMNVSTSSSKHGTNNFISISTSSMPRYKVMYNLTLNLLLPRTVNVSPSSSKHGTNNFISTSSLPRYQITYNLQFDTSVQQAGLVSYNDELSTSHPHHLGFVIYRYAFLPCFHKVSHYHKSTMLLFQ